MLINGLGRLPLAAIVDYELTLTVPPRTTADTHALEAFVSKRANPVSDALALAAMDLIGKNIRTAYAEPNNHAAREAMMIGATQAGLAFSNSWWRWCMACRANRRTFSRAAWSNAMLLPAITRLIHGAGRSALCPGGAALGVRRVSDSDAVAAKLVSGLEALNADLSVPTPSGFGIKEADWNSKMALMAGSGADASGSPNNNPRT